MSGDLGYKCNCGHWNKCESAWAAAHWYEELQHTCKGCDELVVVEGGEWTGFAEDKR